jgi:HAD superfamily hydrolase (TIGR01509 family)
MNHEEHAGAGRRIEAVLFDVDGTLVDSIPFLVECFQAAAREALACEIAAEEILPMVGLPLGEMFRRVRVLDADELAERCTEAYKRIYYPEVVARSPLFPDTRDVVARLSSLGLRLGLVSGKTREGIRRVLEPAGIVDYFAVVVGADHEGRPKPAPDGALAAATALGARPSRTLVVGDSLLDVEMGISAGMLTCGVTTGTALRDELAARAHFVVDRLAEIVTIVEATAYDEA